MPRREDETWQIIISIRRRAADHNDDGADVRRRQPEFGSELRSNGAALLNGRSAGRRRAVGVAKLKTALV